MNARYFLVVALPVLLSGCGLVAAFVPPIEIADPFGVEGQSLTTTFADADTRQAGLTSQANSQAQATFTRTFDDQELDLRGFSLARLDVQVGFGSEVSLSRPVTGRFPTSFTLVRSAGAANLSDEANGAATLAFSHDLELVFTRDAACDVGALSCGYAYVGDPASLASALSVSVSDRSTLAAFVAVLRLDGQNTPNTGRFAFALTAESEPTLDGFSATFTLRSGKATIKLGG